MNAVDPNLIRQLAAAELERRKKLLAMKEDAERDLLSFVRMTWSVLEPATPLVEGWVLGTQCDMLMACVDGHIKKAISNVVPGAMKALDSDTPILTTWGWKRHGDLVPGDFVFGPDGTPKRVLACTAEVFEEAHEVTFDDGATIIAGAGHLWEIERDIITRGPRRRETVVVTTPHLRVSTRSRKGGTGPDRIPVNLPIQHPPRKFLVDPYLLGVWLGDGNTTGGTIYAGAEDADHFAKLGRIARVIPPAGTRKAIFYHIVPEGLQVRLRLLGLLGHKHIPYEYLTASVEQRLSVLQGLMDTDGHCTKEGECIISSVLPELAGNILELLWSLGIKGFMRSKKVVFNGKLCGPYYYVDFRPPVGMPVFRLPRKVARLRYSSNKRTFCRYVDKVSSVGLRRVKCIQVEGNLYLAGRHLVTTHNSLLLNVFFPAWVWGPCNMPWTRFISASYATSLPERDNGRFQRLINSQIYQKCWGDRVKVLKDSVEMVENDRTGWKRVLSIGGTTTGWRANYILIDDPNNPVNVESDDVRQGTNLWLREVMPSRLNNLVEDVIICIQQRTHMADATATLAEMWVDEGMCWVCIPMEFEPLRIGRAIFRWEEDGTPLEEWVDPRSLDENGNQLEGLFQDEKGNLKVRMGSPMAQAEGELCWPERFPPEVIPGMKKIPYVWAGQFQQSPTIRGGGLIRRDWWQVWPARDFPDFGTCVAYLDTAQEQGKENDYNALTCWGAFPGDQGQPQIMLTHGWRDRLPLAQLVARVAEICFERKIDYLVIEHKTRGRDVHDEIVRLYQNAPWQTLLDKVKDDKTSRLNAVSHLFSGDVRKDPQSGMDVWTGGMIYAPDTQWAEDVIDEVCAFPRAPHDDYCFVAGTLIATRRGPVPIEQITLQDECLTPQGWERVLASGFTGVRPVMAARGLVGTADHPVFTLDNGYQPLDSITGASRLGRLSLCGLIRTTLLNSWNSTESVTAAWGARGNTIYPNPRPMQGARTRKGYMSPSGSSILASRFRLVMRSITRTATLSISITRIWSAYRKVCIALCLKSFRTKLLNWSIWKTFEDRQRLGMVQEQVANGTGRTPATASTSQVPQSPIPKSSPKNGYANGAGATSIPSTPVPNAAASLAKQQKILSCEEKTSAVTPIMQPVYNLTVANAHCYYANGILVHNCDTVSGALNWMRKHGVVLRKVEHMAQDAESKKYRKPNRVPYAIRRP